MQEDSLKKSNNEYNCNKCFDRTFILKDNEAIACECRALKEAKEILNKSGISEEFRKKRFKNFNYSKDEQIFNAYKASTDYIRNFKSNEKGKNNSIMLTGQVGCGKTHLCLAIANKLMDEGISVIYMGYREVITSIKQNMMDEVYYNKIMGRYKTCRVLLIDDLFKGSISGSDVNIMFEIINYRYLNGLPVIVSCEKGIDEIMNIDEAIGSRLYEMSCGYVAILSGRRLNYRMYGKS